MHSIEFSAPRSRLPQALVLLSIPCLLILSPGAGAISQQEACASAVPERCADRSQDEWLGVAVYNMVDETSELSDFESFFRDGYWLADDQGSDSSLAYRSLMQCALAEFACQAGASLAPGRMGYNNSETVYYEDVAVEFDYSRGFNSPQRFDQAIQPGSNKEVELVRGTVLGVPARIEKRWYFDTTGPRPDNPRRDGNVFRVQITLPTSRFAYEVHAEYVVALPEGQAVGDRTDEALAALQTVLGSADRRVDQLRRHAEARLANWGGNDLSVDIQIDPPEPYDGQLVTFRADASEIPWDPITEYSWDFDFITDGLPEDDRSRSWQWVADGPLVSGHGDILVYLDVETASGESATARRAFRVRQGSPAAPARQQSFEGRLRVAATGFMPKDRELSFQSRPQHLNVAGIVRGESCGELEGASVSLLDGNGQVLDRVASMDAGFYVIDKALGGAGPAQAPEISFELVKSAPFQADFQYELLPGGDLMNLRVDAEPSVGDFQGMREDEIYSWELRKAGDTDATMPELAAPVSLPAQTGRSFIATLDPGSRYLMKLTLTDRFGCKETVTKTISTGAINLAVEYVSHDELRPLRLAESDVDREIEVRLRAVDTATGRPASGAEIEGRVIKAEPWFLNRHVQLMGTWENLIRVTTDERGLAVVTFSLERDVLAEVDGLTAVRCMPIRDFQGDLTLGFSLVTEEGVPTEADEVLTIPVGVALHYDNYLAVDLANVHAHKFRMWSRLFALDEVGIDPTPIEQQVKQLEHRIARLDSPAELPGFMQSLLGSFDTERPQHDLMDVPRWRERLGMTLDDSLSRLFKCGDARAINEGIRLRMQFLDRHQAAASEHMAEEAQMIFEWQKMYEAIAAGVPGAGQVNDLYAAWYGVNLTDDEVSGLNRAAKAFFALTPAACKVLSRAADPQTVNAVQQLASRFIDPKKLESARAILSRLPSSERWNAVAELVDTGYTSYNIGQADAGYDGGIANAGEVYLQELIYLVEAEFNRPVTNEREREIRHKAVLLQRLDLRGSTLRPANR